MHEEEGYGPMPGGHWEAMFGFGGCIWCLGGTDTVAILVIAGLVTYFVDNKKCHGNRDGESRQFWVTILVMRRCVNDASTGLVRATSTKAPLRRTRVEVRSKTRVCAASHPRPIQGNRSMDMASRPKGARRHIRRYHHGITATSDVGPLGAG